MSVVSEDKQCSERSQIFHFNSSEVKQCGDRNFSVVLHASLAGTFK